MNTNDLIHFHVQQEQQRKIRHEKMIIENIDNQITQALEGNRPDKKFVVNRLEFRKRNHETRLRNLEQGAIV